MTVVLHLTPHLGGGVGKALSSLVEQDAASSSSVRHVFACLEKPDKNQFLNQIRNNGCEVIVAPDISHINNLIATADIIQLEWWNHPATIEFLCRIDQIPMRLIAWCHVSGLHTPIIPKQLIEISDKFIFTSPCSFVSMSVASLQEADASKLAVVSSGGGFSHIPFPNCKPQDPLSIGYMGSLNFAKLHPNYVDFLSSVRNADCKVRLIGDALNRDVLERQCVEADRSGMLDFRGYTTNVDVELQAINVFAYLLNPQHYGTAENALLEAMAMGIVPIVLDNPAESHIVEHQSTGFVVRNSDDFAKTVDWLAHNPEERCRIGMQAAASVRSIYTSEKMKTLFHKYYDEVMLSDKKQRPFQSAFGTTPEEWFISCQEDLDIFQVDGKIRYPIDPMLGYSLLEKSKGSVFHFLKHFPKAKLLKDWANNLELLQ